MMQPSMIFTCFLQEKEILNYHHTRHTQEPKHSFNTITSRKIAHEVAFNGQEGGRIVETFFIKFNMMLYE